LTGPSFHEDSGSDSARVRVPKARLAANASTEAKKMRRWDLIATFPETNGTNIWATADKTRG
jgi:hypothetical protein